MEFGEMRFINLVKEQKSSTPSWHSIDLLAEFSSISQLRVDILHLSTRIELFTDCFANPLHSLMSLFNIVLRLNLSMRRENVSDLCASTSISSAHLSSYIRTQSRLTNRRKPTHVFFTPQSTSIPPIWPSELIRQAFYEQLSNDARRLFY